MEMMQHITGLQLLYTSLASCVGWDVGVLWRQLWLLVLVSKCAEKRALTSAEGYLNRYRNGWATSAAAVKAWVDEMVRRRGKPLGGQAPVPLNEMPVPVPISRFLWPFVSSPAPTCMKYQRPPTRNSRNTEPPPVSAAGAQQGCGLLKQGLVCVSSSHHAQGQGKGARPTEKCGVCLHCTRPALRKGCLNPIVRSENPDEAYDLAAKYALRSPSCPPPVPPQAC